jgi:membrane-bound serine protease (ClpP class)
VLSVVTVLLATAHASAARASGGHVDTAVFNSQVDPAAVHFLTDGSTGVIHRAEQDGAAALVIQIDTPGGDIESMQRIVEAELSSTIPIITYVSPSGGSADSAGTFVALAAPIVAMAPGTRIGAASPIQDTGQDLPPTLKAKVTNALVATMTSLQKTFGRNVDLAVQAITQARSYDDQQAISSHLVNLGANSVTDLLSQVDGQSITLANGTTSTLAVANLPVQTLDPTPLDQIDALLFDPTVQFILFIVAAVCIYLELSHPGAIVPGTVGGIALLLFLYGAGSLNPNWAGLALMLLAIVLLAVDVRAPTHGVLTLGALISLVVGSLLFFNTGPSDQSVSPWLIFGTAAGVGAVSLLVLRYAILSRRAPVDTGTQGLVGQTATVIQPLAPDGRVRVLGEDWAASLSAPRDGGPDRVETGERVRVARVDGLRLMVRPESEPESSGHRK